MTDRLALARPQSGTGMAMASIAHNNMVERSVKNGEIPSGHFK